ncbi:MAG: DUF4234 domain-containing protein [Patescibacteria group bacterium]
MKQRSPVAVLLLPLITFGIYSWYWAVKTKGEMNQQGESIPTAWIWLIPFVGIIWWIWKYSEGVEHVTKGKLSGVLAFVLLWLLGSIGGAIIQNEFNSIGEAPSTTTPDASFGGPVTATPPTTEDVQPPSQQPPQVSS